MSKLFKVLTIAVVVSGLLTGVAQAGPGFNGSADGEPDIPAIADPSGAKPPVLDQGPEIVSQGSSKAVVDDRHDRWVKVLKAYLRLVRVFAI